MAGVGDFNGDGTSDVLIRNTNGTWYAYLMNTDGVSVLQEKYMPFTKDINWKLADTGDFNGDAQADLLFRNSVSGKWYVGLMDATGTNPALSDLSLPYDLNLVNY